MFPCFRSESSCFKTGRSKFYFAIITTMTLLLAFLGIISLLGASAREIPSESEALRNSDLDLKLVHVIFRHGMRTPADTYPNDPLLNETYQPYGLGQLTNAGRLQMFKVGEFLRERYSDFLGKEFKPNEVHAQSTGVTRTKMTLQLVLAGLFPPQGSALEWNKALNWLPIPYSYEELDQDTLLLVRRSCPRYHEELERVFAQDLKAEMDENAPLFEELTKITGLSIKTPDDIQSLFSTLKAETEFGLKLPQWTENFYPHKLKPLTDKSYVYNAYNSELKRLKGGVFVKKAIDDWTKTIAKTSEKKIFLYAGHDSTVTNILSALNVWPGGFPDYGVTTFLEFSQDKKTNAFGVEIFLRNTTTVAPYKLTIPGCAEFCPLDELKVLLKDNIPGGSKTECKSNNADFTEPPPSGP